jgi:hypothetical protein
MIEGNYGRASRLTKQFKAQDREQAWIMATEWCQSKGFGFDIIELIELKAPVEQEVA